MKAIEACAANVLLENVSYLIEKEKAAKSVTKTKHVLCTLI